MQAETRVESAWFQRLNPKYDDMLSSCAFNTNARLYIMEPAHGLSHHTGSYRPKRRSQPP